MRTLRTPSLALLAGTAALAGLVLGTGHAAGPAVPTAAPVPAPAPPATLVAHEWGTFTSFSGSDGVPVGFYPDNSDLPGFVYVQGAPPDSKAARLYQDGTVSMETPVVYFYTDRETRASVRVDFPRGWITEWYPFAAVPPSPTGKRTPGQSMRWDVRLLAGETVKFPGHLRDKNHYYCARETDAVPVQAELPRADDRPDGELQGGSILQREKFLFYRGVGTFPPPVAVKAQGGGSVRVSNALGARVDGVVLVQVRGGKVGFAALGSLDAGVAVTASLPAADAGAVELVELMVKHLTGSGLFEREARAMVKTWDKAWFGEDGTRVLYLVPRARTDELLPLTITPKPTEVVRVLVGRHDFLTPEQEADADQQVIKARAARAELDAAEAQLRTVGRFAPQARQQAEKRTEKVTTDRR